MTVLDIGTCEFSGGGGGALICTGSAVAPTNDNDVVVFVTGRSNHNGSDDDIQRCLVTSAWDAGNDQPVFNRGESGDNCDISYAVVEWTGSNWTVERVRARRRFHHSQEFLAQGSTRTLHQCGSSAFAHGR